MGGIRGIEQVPYRVLIGIPVYLSAPGGRLSSVDPSLSNRDLAPTTREQRTWTTYSYIALWFSMSMEITTYQLASSLIAKGMDWKQAVGTVLLGNLIVLVPMLLNAHAGTRYGIPFPVFIRASFGVRGANLPALLRAIVACGWFGIQSWIGGTAIHSMLAVIWPATTESAFAKWACFLFFWLLNMAGVRGSFHVCDVGGTADMGEDQGGQFRHNAFHPQPIPFDERVSRSIHSVAYGHGRILGNTGAEYS
jgi:hypothetical protein